MHIRSLVVLFFVATVHFAGRAASYDLDQPGLFDQLDPRFPAHRTFLLSRLQIERGDVGGYDLLDESGLSDFNSKISDYLKKPKKYLLNIAKDDFKLYGGFQVKEDWLGIVEDDKNISNLQSILRIKAKAILKGRIEIYQDVSLFRSDSTKNLDEASATGEFLRDPLLSYPPAGRGPIVANRTSFDVQTDRAIIKANLLGVDVMSGRDWLQFKGGYRAGLLFSGLYRPVDMFYRFDYRVWRFGFTALTGQLTDAGKRYISVKRVSLRLAHNLQIGSTEAVAYADDPTAYINPLMLFYISHRNRPNNNDNLIASADISYSPMKNLRLYGEFLDDDLIVFQGGASKYGLLFGLHMSQLLSERTDLRLEYSQVRKWTYTHVSLVNVWEYRGRPFGFWLGPDADELFGQFSYLFSPSSLVRINFDYVRKGEGVIDIPYEEEGGDKTPVFPSGTVERSTGLWLDIRHEVSGFTLVGRLGYRLINNRHNQPGEIDSYFTHCAVVYEL